MTLITYSVGAAPAARISGGFDSTIYGLGYLFLFLAEAATVLTNEYYDYNSDSANRNTGPFTGGSRILVDGSDFAVDASLLLLLRSFPFESEETWSVFMLDFSGISVTVNVQAVGLEEVRVPAGLFECYRVQVSVNLLLFRPAVTSWSNTGESGDPHIRIRYLSHVGDPSRLG